MSKSEGRKPHPPRETQRLRNLTKTEKKALKMIKDGGEQCCSDLDKLLMENPARISEIVDDQGNNIFHLSKDAKITDFLWQYIAYIEFPPEKVEKEGHFKLNCMLRKTNVYKRTPLVEMIHKRASNCVHVLCMIGADVDEMTEDLETPLGIAIKAGFDDVVEILLALGAKPNQMSGGKRPIDIARLLSNEKERENISSLLERYLKYSIFGRESKEIPQPTDEDTSDVASEDLLGNILFGREDPKGDPKELTMKIVELGNDKRAVMALNKWIKKHGFIGEQSEGFNKDFIEKMFLASPTPEMTSELVRLFPYLREKKNVIIKAVESGSYQGVTVLSEEGVNINTISEDKTLLHTAIEDSDVDTVLALLVDGADIGLKSKGKYPIQIAEDNKQSKNGEIIRNLLKDFKKPKPTVLKPGRKRRAKKAALCLDGGGIKGLVLITILEYIQEKSQTPITELFDFVGGTSTGGIIALALGMRDASLDSLRKMTDAKDQLDILKRLYFKMARDVFQSGMTNRSNEITRILQDAFQEDRRPDVPGAPGIHIPMRNIGRAENGEQCMRVFVTALDVGVFPPTPTLIKSYAETEYKVWEAARCSSAAPIYFSNYDKKIDGGLFANNPTLDVLTEIVYNDRWKEEKWCVVSLGCGRQNAKSFDCSDIENDIKNVQWYQGLRYLSSISRAIPKVLDVLVHQATATSGSPVDRSRAWCKSLDWPFYRFDPEFENLVSLDERDIRALHNMIWQTRRYLNENEQEIDALVRDLV